MKRDAVRLPDGTEFLFWDDRTAYGREYHVAGAAAGAADGNDGSAERPFKTIGRAAEVAGPGEKVIIHGGAYRECVRPARGGESAEKMIAYEAAPGERVVVKGSRVWRPQVRASSGWRMALGGEKVWMADLPAEWFGAYNPFVANNMFGHLCEFVSDWSRPEMERFLLKRGGVYVNGRPLAQVLHARELAERDGAFWVEEPGLRLHFRLAGDADPRVAEFEVTVQEQVFCPRERGLGYIRLSGIEFEHAADGVPVPQRAMVSTWRGHHWIIENCRARWANAVGMDIGEEDWRSDGATVPGGHVVRGNVITDCGVCGLAGVKGVDGALVEANMFERIGGLVSERLWEVAACKLHVAKGVLIRRNVFRHLRGASGLWLDYLNENCRVTDNVFADIETRQGAVFLEVSHRPNLIDGNVIWGIRSHDGTVAKGTAWHSGMGVSVDTCDHTVVAHNVIGQIPHSHALALHLGQKDRLVGGRVGLCRGQGVFNNLLVECPRRVQLGQAVENQFDGNVYDRGNSDASLCLQGPTPAVLNLPAWREFYGFDRAAAEARIEASFDCDALVLKLKVAGISGEAARVGLCAGVMEHERVGPFTPAQWEKISGAGLEVRVPLAHE